MHRYVPQSMQKKGEFRDESMQAGLLRLMGLRSIVLQAISCMEEYASAHFWSDSVFRVAAKNMALLVMFQMQRAAKKTQSKCKRGHHRSLIHSTGVSWSQEAVSQTS